MSNSRQIRVLRDGQENGTYTVDGAMMLLQAGHLKNTDLYWEVGMAEWAPLSQLMALEIDRVRKEPYRTSSHIYYVPMNSLGDSRRTRTKEAEHSDGCLVLVIPLIASGLLFIFDIYTFVNDPSGRAPGPDARGLMAKFGTGGRSPGALLANFADALLVSGFRLMSFSVIDAVLFIL